MFGRSVGSWDDGLRERDKKKDFAQTRVKIEQREVKKEQGSISKIDAVQFKINTGTQDKKADAAQP